MQVGRKGDRREGDINNNKIIIIVFIRRHISGICLLRDAYNATLVKCNIT